MSGVDLHARAATPVHPEHSRGSGQPIDGHGDSVVSTRTPSPRFIVAMCFLAVVIGYTDRVNIAVASIPMRDELGWSSTTQGVVLSAFFVGYLSCMALSGWLATRFGGARLLGIAVLVWSVFTLATPIAAETSLSTLIAVRIGMGIGESAMFPACYELIGRYVPAEFRTRAVTRILSGIAVGTVAGLTSCGWIVANLDWPAAFYVFGVLGIGWTVAWLWAMRPSNGAGAAAAQERSKLEVPWRRLVNVPAVWALFASHFCANWALYFFISWLPTYFTQARGLSLEAAGSFSGIPWLVMAAATMSAGWFADTAVQRGVDLTVVRKTLQTIGLIVPAVSLVLLQHTESALGALVLVCLAVGSLGCTWAGCSANAIDLAPRHSAAIMGVSNTVATIPGVVGVSLTGWIVDVTGTFTAAFILTAILCVVGALVYLVWASARQIV